MARPTQQDNFKKQLESLEKFGKIEIRKDINEKYLVDNKLLNITELAWRRILLSCNQEQTKIVWSVLLNPEKYGFLDRPLNDIEKNQIRRMLCKIDRVYLAQLLADKNDPNHSFRKILNHKWVYDRCREVERDSEGYLELWPRSHFKSVICNQLEIIQEHLINPKLTIIVITYAVSFAQYVYDYVRNVYTHNKALKTLFPDIFYQNDAFKESPAGKWTSENLWLKPISGGQVREPSLTYCSIVNLKVGRHFGKRIYDDIITAESVNSPQTIEKINQKISDSKNIGTPGGTINREHYVGTRYHKNDSYQWQIDNAMVKTRVYSATHNGKMDGKPVLLTEEEWTEKKKDHSYVVACNYLMNPTMSENSIFDIKYLKQYSVIRPMDIFILVDPASGKKLHSDYTAISVLGIDSHKNIYLLDGVRDKLDLYETWTKLRNMHKKWSDFIPERGYSVHVLYEQFGASRDIEMLKMLMAQYSYHFDIHPVSFGSNGERSKKDRASRLIPDMKRGKFYVPNVVYRNGQAFTWKVVTDSVTEMQTICYEKIDNPEYKVLHSETDYKTINVVPLRKITTAHEEYDFTLELLDELESFPYGKHDDVVDATSRIYDFPDLHSYVSTPQRSPRVNYTY